MPDGAIIAFDVSVLLRLSGLNVLNVLNGNTLFLSPFHPLPGRVLRSNVPRGSLPLIYSGPLSTRIVSGLPRHSMIRSRLRITRSAGKEKSTSMPKPSRLKSSSTFKSRNARPSPRRSAMKSPLIDCKAINCRAAIDQVTFGASGTANASGLSRFRRLRGLMRRFNSSSQ